MTPHVKVMTVTADLISGAAIAAALMQWLPPIAALGGIIWYAIQIWESKTVQKWNRVHRLRARIRRQAIKAVKAKLRLAEANDALETIAHGEASTPHES